jgi:hypothetical protein
VGVAVVGSGDGVVVEQMVVVVVVVVVAVVVVRAWRSRVRQWCGRPWGGLNWLRPGMDCTAADDGRGGAADLGGDILGARGGCVDGRQAAVEGVGVGVGERGRASATSRECAVMIMRRVRTESVRWGIAA